MPALRCVPSATECVFSKSQLELDVFEIVEKLVILGLGSCCYSKLLILSYTWKLQ
jgi:hypothetical protein